MTERPSPPLQTKVIRHGAAIAAFTALACLLTWPIPSRLGSEIAGPAGDNLGGVHTLWWTWFEVSRGRFPWAIDLMAFPSSQVVFHPSPLMQAASMPLTAAFDPVAASNLLLIASFALTGYFTFLLVDHLITGWAIAFTAGALFTAAAPHQFDILFNTNALFALPLLWLALTLWREDSRRWPFVAIAGVLLALSNFYFAAYFLPPTALAFAPWRDLRDLSLVGRYVAGFAVPLAISVAVYLPSVAAAGAGTGDELRAAATRPNARPPTELLATVIGSPAHPTLGGFFDWLGSSLDPTQAPNVGSAYIGLTVLVLALLGWRSARRTGPWTFLAVAGLVLMLGPHLRIAGTDSVPLPYGAYVQIPGISYLRAPARFYYLMELALVVMAAFGLRALTQRLSVSVDTTTRRAIAASATVLAIGAFGVYESLLRFPIPTAPAAVPAVYSKLATLPRDTALIEAPGGAFNDYQWLSYQRVSHLPLVNNAAPRPSTESMRLVLGNAFLLHSLVGPDSDFIAADQERFEETGIRDGPRVQGVEDLARIGVGYAVLHKQTIFEWADPDDPRFRLFRSYLRRYLGRPVYEDPEVVIFALPSAPDRDRVATWAQSEPAPATPATR